MLASQKDKIAQFLKMYTADVEEARQTGNQTQLCLALANVGLMAFVERDYQAGMQAFDEGYAIVTELNRPRLTAQFLGIKSQAFQEANRLHDAFNTVQEIYALAERVDDDAMKCDALTAQGQILVAAGDEQKGFECLQMARVLADASDDDVRQMRVRSAMGHMHLNLGGLAEATAYFDVALACALRLENSEAECGFRLNLGTLYHWQGQFERAVEMLEMVLPLAADQNTPSVELSARLHLVQCLIALEQFEATSTHIAVALELADTLDDTNGLEALYDAQIQVYRATNQPQALLQALHHALDVASTERKLELQMQLGDAYLDAALYPEAERAYRHALGIARAYENHVEEVILVGRLGVAQAEQGQLSQAIKHHQNAMALAQQRSLPVLQAEQLLMLAMAYAQQDDKDQARNCCSQAIGIYSVLGAQEGQAQAQQLLQQIGY